MKNFIKNINPENNAKIRATLYIIGTGGAIHLMVLLVVAVINRKAAYFNPLYAIDVDHLWPTLLNGMLIYILGWAVFAGFIYLVYRLINKK